MSQLLTSGTVLAAFFGGLVALLVPCCVSVMLPAYFASGFRRRSRILVMTFVFGGGVGTIILPIALGASFLSSLVLAHHTPVFATGGALMIAGGLAMFFGWTMKIPMPGWAPAPGRSLGSVWALGAFSGVASACCAPVLAGVAALAGAAGSFGTALIIGVAYVFGMVAPLALFALVWDRRDWGQSRLFRVAGLGVDGAPMRGRTSVAGLLSGGLLVAMGVLTVVIAVRGPQMSNDGWQVRLAARLQHYSTQALHGMAWLPGWAGTVLVLGMLAAFTWSAVRLGGRHDAEPASPTPSGPPEGEAHQAGLRAGACTDPERRTAEL